MKNLKINNLEKSNQNSYDDLIISIEAGQGNLNLLLAVCDEFNYRSQLIEKYEQELININIRPFRINLNLQDPSLYQALLSLYQSEDYLQQRKKAVITVLGITDLLALKLGESRSKLEIFIDYLQYTREGLRDFPFPIVLWLTNTIHDQIAQRAVDFYSWRKGVFFFSSSEIATVQSLVNLSKNLSDSTEVKEEEIGMLKIEDLQDLIAQKKGKPDGSLATLYSSLGDAYQQKLDQGKSSNYQRDVHEAITAYKKAIDIQTTLNSPLELAISLNNLALLYKSQGRYSEAEPLLVRSLTIYEEQLVANHPDTATSLNNLASLYESQGRYSEAEPLYVRALTIYEEQLGANHPHTAFSLNNLALLYKSQGRYQEAEPLLVRALAIWEEQLGANHPHTAQSLNNLSILYRSQGRYQEAEPLLVRALTIREEQLGANHPDTATSLNNLANLYRSQGRYQEAEPLLVRALTIREEQLGENHPDTATSLNNLALFYESQGQLKKAEEFAQRALNIYQSTLGNHHPYTINSLLTVKLVQMQMVLGCDQQTLFGILQEIAQMKGITELNNEIYIQLLELMENNPPLIEIIKQRLSL